LREVGTTNRTYLSDYREAIGPDTGLILKVHRSNFEIHGFTCEATLRELASLARERGVPLVDDRGSGTFVDLRPYGIPESEAWRGLREGADLVLFSGDKLLGGPQAGIVLGNRELVERMQRSPLARALRVDKLTLASLAWTLQSLLAGRGQESLPVLRMLLAPQAELQARAEQLAKALARQGWPQVSVELQGSVVGGGTLPELELHGPVVRLEPDGSAEQLVCRLRRADPPVLVRVHKDAVLLDPRTLSDAELDAVVAAFASVLD
jgi:L-seryl-tRNA(Ser) seleniumtransferase